MQWCNKIDKYKVCGDDDDNVEKVIFNIRGKPDQS